MGASVKRKLFSKRDRQYLVARNLPKLLPLPCGCVPRLASCQCPLECCECELELEICSCSADWESDEIATFNAKLRTFYAELDPGSYLDPVMPRGPILSATLSIDARIAQYASRWESGRAIFHPKDSKVGEMKNGETCEMNGNHTARRTGANAAPETTYRPRKEANKLPKHISRY